VAVAVLSKLGYKVVAVSGRVEEADDLKRLGAADVLPRAEFSSPGKPLGRRRRRGRQPYPDQRLRQSALSVLLMTDTA